MNQVTDFLDMGIEQPDRIGTGQHDAGHFAVEFLFQGFHAHQAVFVAGDGLDRIPGNRSAGGVGSVGTVGNQHDLFLVALAAMIGGHHHNARQFAVRSGHRLHREGGHAGDLPQHHIRIIQHLQGTLCQHAAHPQLRQQRMQMRKTRVGRDPLADLGIVFHRTRAQRIEHRIYAEIPTRQFGKMPHRVQLAQFRQRQVVPQQLRFNMHARRHIAFSNPQPLTPRHTFFKYQFHCISPMSFPRRACPRESVGRESRFLKPQISQITQISTF